MQYATYNPCNISSRPTSGAKCLLHVGCETCGEAESKVVSVTEKEQVLATSRSRADLLEGRVPSGETVGENEES